jgi:putative phosphoesterase
VWHAGDIGDQTVANRLENFKPLRAVFGNIDDKSLQSRFPEDLFFTCEELNVWITHIGGFPPNYNARVKKILQSKLPQIFICGHSHILRIAKDPNFKNLLYINPGAAGNQGFHRTKTVVRFEVTGKEIKNMEVIELGLRGAI